jgi:hypothetical protein
MNRKIIQSFLPLEPGASERPVRTKRPSRREAGAKANSDEPVFVPTKLVRVVGDFDGLDLKVYLCLRAAAGRSQVTDLTIEDVGIGVTITPSDLKSAARNNE